MNTDTIQGNNWINSEEQRPNPFQEVLGWLKYKECFGIVYYNEHTWWHEVHDEVTVTHWMYMPEPPK